MICKKRFIKILKRDDKQNPHLRPAAGGGGLSSGARGRGRGHLFATVPDHILIFIESIYNVLKFEVVKNILLDVGVEILGWDILFFVDIMFCNLVFGILF